MAAQDSPEILDFSEMASSHPYVTDLRDLRKT